MNGLVNLMKNGVVTITRAAHTGPVFGPVNCIVSLPVGQGGTIDYSILGTGFADQFAPTDSITFNVPNTLSATLELKEGDIFTVTNGGQKNGEYSFVSRPAATNPFFGGPTQFRCFVRKVRGPA
ncbi:MAG: hypothetical protein HXX20_02225 [Chloroflexi bacterium]|nr:hypothetical protein [Chloroflexota bacterium]